MATRKPIDLSDNQTRATVLSSLVSSITAGQSPDFASWSLPDHSQPPPEPTLGIDNVWHTLNQLRVLGQYSRLLGDLCDHHPFLTGSRSTCVLGLEWASALLRPMQTLAPEVRAGLVKTHAIATDGGPLDTQSLFNLHRMVPCPDDGILRLLLEQKFPNSTEFEFEVAKHMLSQPQVRLAAWLRDFPSWRSKGLYYPLAVASQHMPTLHHWLPPKYHTTRLAAQLDDAVQAFRRRGADAVRCLQTMANAWGEDEPAALLIAGLFDRIAVLAGVKANGRKYNPNDFDLRNALDAFPRSFGNPAHQGNYVAWHALRYRIEDAFPPSLLCAPLVHPRRQTWGYPTLTLAVSNDAVVRFVESDLQPIAPADCHDLYQHTPAFTRGCPVVQTSARVQDVLWRIGEVVLSPGVAACMLHPEIASGAHAGEDLHITPEEALASMCPIHASETAPAVYLDAMTRLESTVPPIHEVPIPGALTLLLWRLDIPGRAIIYIGDGTDMGPEHTARHHGQKLLLNCKAPPSNAGGVLVVPAGAVLNDALVRAAARGYAAGRLADHPGNTVLVQLDGGREPDDLDPARVAAPLVHTTLAESFACLSLVEPPQVSVVQVTQSCPWKEDGIDPRYAERQSADNGFRFRDWAAMHVSRTVTQQSRLAAHVVSMDTLFLTHMPWISPAGTRWLRVASTIRPTSKTLQGPTMRAAVEGRFLYDVAMLPVREEGQTVSRSDTELYQDDNGTIAIVYAPKGAPRLEMMAFKAV
jgi:hypothetical protein